MSAAAASEHFSPPHHKTRNLLPPCALFILTIMCLYRHALTGTRRPMIYSSLDIILRLVVMEGRRRADTGFECLILWASALRFRASIQGLFTSFAFDAFHRFEYALLFCLTPGMLATASSPFQPNIIDAGRFDSVYIWVLSIIDASRSAQPHLPPINITSRHLRYSEPIINSIPPK